MEINKQLFEDVLSGKLTGKFIFRNGKQCNSNCLFINHFDGFSSSHPYYINGASYNPNGIYTYDTFEESELDIVDFIPDTNMKENELTIEIPEGKIVDWEASQKQNKIVLKDKQLTYENICEKLFEKGHYMIVDWGGIKFNGTKTGINCINNAISEHQLECILAKNRLANVAKYLNDGWRPVYNVQSPYLNKDVWIISNFLNGTYPVKVMQNSAASGSGTVFFKSEELAQQAIEILGEETVKLALEPLGI